MVPGQHAIQGGGQRELELRDFVKEAEVRHGDPHSFGAVAFVKAYEHPIFARVRFRTTDERVNLRTRTLNTELPSITRGNTA